MDIEKDLERIRSLYQKGEYETAGKAAETLRNIYFASITEEQFAETYRIEAWAFYYLGIKGNPDDKIVNVNYARLCAEHVLYYSKDPQRRLSAANVLPLTLWILDRRDDAIKASDEALKEFLDDAWDTRGILARWGGFHEEGVAIGDKVTESAIAKGDFLTAGHGQQNKGDALRLLGRNDEARSAFEEALKRYRQYERASGKSAAPHIASIEKKLAK